ncbi:MAG: Amidohydrolase [Lentisphaerae bacterium ADurb.Bin242]|nr:MAG: Amidohydrolase [Lentisphaerae bacterium ADurb.Bin242]
MRKFDFHFHCDIDDSSKIAELAALCRKLDTVLALSGGLRYGSHDYLPNEKVLEICQKNPDWFVPMAKFDLWDTVEPDRIYRWKETGVKGVKFIYPYYPYDHDLYMPVYEACEDCGLPALFHTGSFRPGPADVEWKRPVLTNMSPFGLDRIARSFQKLHIVMAHLGTRLYREQAASLVCQHPNLYADLAGSGSWMGVQPEELERLFKPFPTAFLGEDIFKNFRKIVYGSDGYVSYPAPLSESQPYYERLLRLNNVPEEIRNGIMGGTAASWMGIPL